MSNEFIVDDGLREYTFKNTQGVVFAKFSFNATDTSIIKRYDKAIEQYKEIVLSEDENMDEILETENKIMECFSIIFNHDMTEELFGTYRPLALFGNGQFYCQYIFERIEEIVNKEFDARLESSKTKVKKATKKYIR